ncbi:33248_t:CDS:1, partial [Gigaspora margarita]
MFLVIFEEFFSLPSPNVLKLSGFTNSVKLNFKYTSLEQITYLGLNDCINLEEINIQYNRLEELDASNLDKLRKLDLFSRTLKRLILGKKKQHLSYLSCNHNQLTCLDFNALEPKILSYLSLTNNNFSDQDLVIFIKFTNLRLLSVGYYEYNGKKNNNQFYGSQIFWQGLRNLNKLRSLYVNNIRLSKEKHKDLEKGYFCELGINIDFLFIRNLKNLWYISCTLESQLAIWLGKSGLYQGTAANKTEWFRN